MSPLLEKGKRGPVTEATICPRITVGDLQMMVQLDTSSMVTKLGKCARRKPYLPSNHKSFCFRRPAHTSSEMTLNVMTSLLYTVAILWPAVCVCFLSADSQISMSARVDSSAVLPCQLRNMPAETPHVEWRTISGKVLERFGQDLYQGKGYEDRVDVPEDHLLKGNCSLVLKNIRPDDAGVYKSFLSVKEGVHSKWVFLQSVELSVDEIPQEFIKRFLEDDAAPERALNLTGITAFILILCFLFHKLCKVRKICPYRHAGEEV